MTPERHYFDNSNSFYIDTHFISVGRCSCFFLNKEGTDEWVIVEPSSHMCVEKAVLSVIKELNITSVAFVVVTHVHLDHSGGAGLLAQHFPDAKFLVHENGAKHLVDPTILNSAAVQVYDPTEYANYIGPALPIPEASVVPVKEGDIIKWGNENIRVFDAFGHAFHSAAFHFEEMNILFPGDAVAMNLELIRDIETPDANIKNAKILPSAPTQFKPKLWATTLSKFLSLPAANIGLSHFGYIPSEDYHAFMNDSMYLLTEHARICDEARSLDDIDNEFMNLYGERLDLTEEERKMFITEWFYICVAGCKHLWKRNLAKMSQ
ncbi:hypothetical protein PCE1_002280 [Barthelona sp. PCE]